MRRSLGCEPLREWQNEFFGEPRCQRDRSPRLAKDLPHLSIRVTFITLLFAARLPFGWEEQLNWKIKPGDVRDVRRLVAAINNGSSPTLDRLSHLLCRWLLTAEYQPAGRFAGSSAKQFTFINVATGMIRKFRLAVRFTRRVC